MRLWLSMTMNTIERAGLQDVTGGLASGPPGTVLVLAPRRPNGFQSGPAPKLAAPDGYLGGRNWHVEKNGFWASNSDGRMAFPTKAFWELVARNHGGRKMRLGW